MPLSSEVVGRTGEPVEHDVDARWTMAYAAALGDAEAAYFDTLARADVLAHPLFPVCFEWPVFLSGRHLPSTKALAPEERVRGVHATHDVRLHRPPRAGMRVTTRATVARIEARRPGAYQVVRLDSVAEDGEPVCTTWYGSLFRGVGVQGGDRVAGHGEPELPRAPDAPAKLEVALPIPAGLAHVYTECARIWNPIHTDAAVAASAGLPGIILHGTATLALAVSAIVRHALDGDPERVRRIAARFAAMVPLPSTCTLRVLDAPGDALRFDVLNEKGEAAVRDGLIEARG